VNGAVVFLGLCLHFCCVAEVPLFLLSLCASNEAVQVCDDCESLV
jgi:hypothetical protein